MRKAERAEQSSEPEKVARVGIVTGAGAARRG
jgi:hypothetical protein